MSQPIDTSEILHELNKNTSDLTVFKQYVAGNTYNGVLLAVTGTNWTTTRGVFVPYLTKETSKGSDSAYRLIMNIRGTLSVAASSPTITVTGINAPPGAGAAFYSTGTMTGGSYVSGSTIYVTFASNVSSFAVSLDVELNSKPTWMD